MADHYTIAQRSFAFMSCGKCGIEFMMPSPFQRECFEKGASMTWYCPNGHPRVYRTGEADELRRERDRLKQQLAQKDDEIAAAVNAQAKAEREKTRILKRVNAGLCTCCNRSFANLARHMKTKHPEEAKLKVA